MAYAELIRSVREYLWCPKTWIWLDWEMRSLLLVKEVVQGRIDEIFTQAQEGAIVVVKTICHPRLSFLPGKIETSARIKMNCKRMESLYEMKHPTIYAHKESRAEALIFS